MNLADARLRLGLTDGDLKVVRETLTRDELPTEPLDRWTIACAQGWAKQNEPSSTPYRPAGFLIAFVRKQVSLERRRKRAAAQGKTIQEDRAAFHRAYHDEHERQLEAARQDLGPPPPHELPPHFGQLHSAWRELVQATAEWKTLDQLASLEGPVGEIAANLVRLRSQEARERQDLYRNRSERPQDERLNRYLDGERDHLQPAPDHPVRRNLDLIQGGLTTTPEDEPL